MRRFVYFSLISFIVVAVISCVTLPQGFVVTGDPTWSTIEIRDGMDYELAWREVVDVIAKKFEMEMLSKDGAYLRTAWSHSWYAAGRVSQNYRVRVIAKFSTDRRKVDVKTEANYLGRAGWVSGTDTRLLTTVKTDIMGVVGRVTR
jgi:hypothetical protein